MAGRQVASHLDLTQNNDPAAPPSGLTRIKAKVDGDVVVVTPDGQEKSIVNVDGPAGEVTKLIIDGGAPDTIPENYVLRFDFGGVV